MLLPRRTAFEQRRSCIKRSSNRSSSRPCKRIQFNAVAPCKRIQDTSIQDTSTVHWSQSFKHCTSRCCKPRPRKSTIMFTNNG
jgi:hypothetical protein